MISFLKIPFSITTPSPSTGEGSGLGVLLSQALLTIQILSLVTAKIDDDLFKHDTWVIWSKGESMNAVR